MRRAPSREFAIGFGDFTFPISGKQGERRSKTGVPSRDFLENFLSNLGTPAASTPAQASEAPSSSAPNTPEAVPSDKLAALFSAKTPRRGGPSYRPVPRTQSARESGIKKARIRAAAKE
jgi:hypothetical protein